MADDWDLFAVVRSCSSSATSSSSASTVSTISSVDNFLPLPDPMAAMSLERRDEDLQDLFKPFFPKFKPLVPISPLYGLDKLPPERSEAAAAAVLSPVQIPVKRHSVLGSGEAAPSPRSKRRKVQMKRVCQVAAEDSSSDTWSWRKYGQKPIKGSPYPRGYYKCSTSKGCLARKQVERNRSDPGMFIVTYTSDHNHPMPPHRNSLSGITRLKLEAPTTTATATVTAVTDSTAEKMENKEEKEDFLEVGEEEDDFGGSDMVVGDDFFEGLEEFRNCITDHFPGNKDTTAGGEGS